MVRATMGIAAPTAAIATPSAIIAQPKEVSFAKAGMLIVETGDTSRASLILPLDNLLEGKRFLQATAT